ncbi:type II toxin-antitoxin system HicA family toxin [Methanocalculus sp. MSAO_Arc2]|uniref:type II toxin-antitoxin system HicA family toxin n=1 Tax=Methanocalculus sp. MSAO_Arc2 TaxID=2293855 RepID=UPI0032174E13
MHIRGSHQYLHHAERGFLVTVSVHSGQIMAPKTLQAILSQAGLLPKEFRKLL